MAKNAKWFTLHLVQTKEFSQNCDLQRFIDDSRAQIRNVWKCDLVWILNDFIKDIFIV